VGIIKQLLLYVASTQWSTVWHMTHRKGLVVTRGERDIHWSAVLVRSCMHTLVL